MSEPNAPSMLGRVLHGRYRIERHLGEGGMSDVYVARLLPQLAIPFAIKILKPHFVHHSDFGRRFRFEAELLTRLEHPNIVRVHELFEDSGFVCMVQAFVDGESLADRIRRTGAMQAEQALPLFKRVLEALDHAHQQGVIHRDVKPSNILLDVDDNPMLCDFGIAKQIGQRGMTAVGVKLGTPQYMSPEQIKGLETQPVDHRSDIYSAGIVLYEMLSGQVPFDCTSTRSEFEVLRQQVGDAPPDLRSLNAEVDPALSTIVHKALRKDPARRYQGAIQFKQAIEGFERHTGGREDREKGDESPQPGRRRYAVYAHPLYTPEAVKIGLCWPVLLLSPVWMLYRRLYLHAVIWLCLWLLLCLILVWWLVEGDARNASLWIAVLVFGSMLVWLTPLFQGNRWREQALQRQGYTRVGELPAASAATAISGVAHEEVDRVR